MSWELLGAFKNTNLISYFLPLNIKHHQSDFQQMADKPQFLSVLTWDTPCHPHSWTDRLSASNFLLVKLRRNTVYFINNLHVTSCSDWRRCLIPRKTSSRQANRQSQTIMKTLRGLEETKPLSFRKDATDLEKKDRIWSCPGRKVGKSSDEIRKGKECDQNAMREKFIKWFLLLLLLLFCIVSLQEKSLTHQPPTREPVGYTFKPKQGFKCYSV